MCKRYVASKRHTMQVDFDDYLLRAGARSAGRARSARAGRVPAARGARGRGADAQVAA